jgi:hypothetical protein
MSIKNFKISTGLDLEGLVLTAGQGELLVNGNPITTDLTGYATETYVTTQGYITSADLSGYALTTDIPSLQGYATETYVTTQGYLVSSDLSGYATESYVTTQGYLVSSDLSGYALTTDIPSLTGYVTEDGTQTLSNKTFSDAITLTGTGAFTITGDSDIVLATTAPGNSYLGSVSAENALATVGTAQDISNKRIIDTLYFTDGVTINDEGQIAVLAQTHEFEIKANYGDITLETVAAPSGVGSNVNISSLYGDIVLTAPAQGKNAYIGSVAAGNEIATRSYVDGVAQGLDIKESVVVATSTNIDISTFDYSTELIDGVSIVEGQRVLLRGQTDITENGIYVGYNSGQVTGIVRASDATSPGWTSENDLTSGSFTFVENGTDAGKGFVATVTGSMTPGAANVTWTQFSEAGNYITSVGTGLTVSTGNLTLDLPVPPVYVAGETLDVLSGLSSDIGSVDFSNYYNYTDFITTGTFTSEDLATFNTKFPVNSVLLVAGYENNNYIDVEFRITSAAVLSQDSTKIQLTGLDVYRGPNYATIVPNYINSTQYNSGKFLTNDGTSTKWAALDKVYVGLDQVDNTSDLNKPVSTATQAALDLKQDELTAGTGIDITDGTISSTVVGLVETVDSSFVVTDGELSLSDTITIASVELTDSVASVTAASDVFGNASESTYAMGSAVTIGTLPTGADVADVFVTLKATISGDSVSRTSKLTYVNTGGDAPTWTEYGIIVSGAFPATTVGFDSSGNITANVTGSGNYAVKGVATILK